MNTTDNVLKELDKLMSRDTKAVFVSGNFNIVHPGHLRLLRFAKECGNFLIVGVNDSTSRDAILEEKLRLESVASIGFVDYAFILSEKPEIFIERVKPDVVVKGKEHEHTNNPEQESVQQYGGKLLFGSGDISFSSIDLLKEEFQQLNLSTIVIPSDYLVRHDISIKSLEKALDDMKKLRVCVIGDTIVDEYITCDPLGMSQEDPTIVVTPVMSERFIGGAAIVAAHARGLGAQVNYFSVVGKDSIANIAKDKMEEHDVKCKLYEDDSRPTTLKQRYRASGKTLLRVSHLRSQEISKELKSSILGDLKIALENADLLIFADYNYGCLPQNLVEEISEFCKQKNIPFVADSQSSSQVGNISRFKGTTLVTPTEREARLSVMDNNSGLVVLAEKLRKEAAAENVIITLGSEGVLVHASVDGNDAWHTDRLPSFNRSAKDTAGAGDSFLTCASMALVCGCNIWQSAYIGSLAAACQVGRLGNIPLSPDELLTEMNLKQSL